MAHNRAMKNTLEELARSAISAALKAGADSADVITLEGRSVSLDMREGKLEQAERAEGTDLGLRVMVGQRQAMVSSSDTRPEALLQVAERAVAMAHEAPEDPYIGLAAPDQLAQSWDIAALQLHDETPEPSPEVLQDDARRAEAAATLPRTQPGFLSRRPDAHREPPRRNEWRPLQRNPQPPSSPSR